ncbi:c-type cytochrome [Devosia epidermidihirudinis]|uniref:c-type cytochrome n=1 Tax=Devosia epidermidihirudinis TaxID=1293439 RepID=UPI0006986B65|nr:cytochrome c [Devosia epidermidihirudinis]
MRVFTSLIVSACLLTGAAFAQDAAPKVDDSTAWFGSSSVLTQQTGEGIYKAVCASCHMPKGEGAVGAGKYPALAGNETLEFPEYPIYMVTMGGGAMPALGTVLNDDQIAAVVNYIRTSFGNTYNEDPATPEMVAETR